MELMLAWLVPLGVLFLGLVIPIMLLAKVSDILTVVRDGRRYPVSSWKITDATILFHLGTDRSVFELFLPNPTPVVLRDNQVDIAGYSFTVFGSKAGALFKDLSDLQRRLSVERPA